MATPPAVTTAPALFPPRAFLALPNSPHASRSPKRRAAHHGADHPRDSPLRWLRRYGRGYLRAWRAGPLTQRSPCVGVPILQAPVRLPRRRRSHLHHRHGPGVLWRPRALPSALSHAPGWDPAVRRLGHRGRRVSIARNWFPVGSTDFIRRRQNSASLSSAGGVGNPLRTRGAASWRRGGVMDNEPLSAHEGTDEVFLLAPYPRTPGHHCYATTAPQRHAVWPATVQSTISHGPPAVVALHSGRMRCMRLWQGTSLVGCAGLHSTCQP